MSIDNATPQEWDRSTNRISNKTGLEAWETPHPKYSVKNEREYFDKHNQPDADPVNNPSHYNAGGIECLDAIEASMTPEAFKGYCKGNCQKYIWRMSYKGKPVEDLRKAKFYLERLIAAEIATPTKP